METAGPLSVVSTDVSLLEILEQDGLWHWPFLFEAQLGQSLAQEQRHLGQKHRRNWEVS